MRSKEDIERHIEKAIASIAQANYETAQAWAMIAQAETFALLVERLDGMTSAVEFADGTANNSLRTLDVGRY